VGLAQALCRSPDLLLLDEPFSALDAPVRRELRRELRRLQRETGLTTVLVTHDPEEAAILADEVIVVANGASLQSGTTRQVFSRPSSPEVARLLGISNLHRAVVVGEGRIDADGAPVDVDTANLGPGTAVLWSIRPEHIRLSPTAALSGTLTDIADIGTATELIIAVSPELELELRTPDPMDLEVGDVCHIELPRDAITLWPAADRAALDLA
jgi:molybdate transport system permease protein